MKKFVASILAITMIFTSINIPVGTAFAQDVTPGPKKVINNVSDITWT